MDSYLEKTIEVYRDAALKPDVGLCCTTSPTWKLPGLEVPGIMLEMNYGCGTTVNPNDINENAKILYVGVGGGMELLQFAYFSRTAGGVIGVDVVDEMLEVCKHNLGEAEQANDWFSSQFVDLRKGSALELPVDDESVDVFAQNCLFNIFKEEELEQALKESYRALKPGGRLVLSDPICEHDIPAHLRNDEKLRAECISGALPLGDYVKRITDVGFGTIEIRARRPYRILDPNKYNIDHRIYIESIELCAIKDPMPEDGPCVFTGKAAIYHGSQEYYDDKKGHILTQNQPVSVCDKTAGALAALNNPDIFISESTWFYDGGGCC